MNIFIYNGNIYYSKKELREATGLSRTKIQAKIKDKEIVLIINTGDSPYGSNYKTTI